MIKQTSMRINDEIDIEDIRHTDLHMHTIYCDGKDTPEAMVQSALDKGFSCIGFSGHSYVAFDQQAGMEEERLQAYVREITRLKEVYAGRIRIYCGIELDYHALPEPGIKAYQTALARHKETFDYIIGSVHYIPLARTVGYKKCEAEKDEHPCDNEGIGKAGCFESTGFAAVDDTPQILMDAVQQFYDGDYYQAAEVYYQLVSDVVHHTCCDIIGHFDLFSKFNQKYNLFDEHHPRYVQAWKKAADHLSAAGKVFEINTGGMSREWRDVPYPTPEMQDYIRSKGSRFILSSDSHNKDTIGYLFQGITIHS